MKRYLLAIFITICIPPSVFAQAPQSIPYQAVARDASGNLLVNTTVCVQYRIYSAITGGTLLYEEHQTSTTNKLGLFTASVGLGTYEIGSGSTYTALSAINWGSTGAFIEIGLDLTGGCTGSNTYTTMGRSQMMSVPYALYAASAASAVTAPLAGAGTVSSPITVAANSASSAGVVAAGSGNTNKVWGTDASGNPGWTGGNTNVVGAALTETNDANVTLTLGGSPLTALLNSTSITAGWAGQLAVSRGGTGVGTLTGYVYGNGTGAMTASTSIPYSALTGTPAIPGASNYIVNGTGSQASANFNIAGAGTVGTTFSAGTNIIAGGSVTASSFALSAATISAATATANTSIYGSVDMSGNNNGYAGIDFTDEGVILMMNSGVQGVYTQADAWLWYFSNGVLTVGSVPWARVTGFSITTTGTGAATLTTGVLNIPTPTAASVGAQAPITLGFAGSVDAAGNVPATFSSNTLNVPSHGKKMFTASGSFTVPAGVTTVWVSGSAGGGGGGENSSSNGIGQGGGGGGASCKDVSLSGLTPTAVINVTVGAAGAANASGIAAAESSWFGGTSASSTNAYIILGGGAGVGVIASQEAGGAGGTGSICSSCANSVTSSGIAVPGTKGGGGGNIQSGGTGGGSLFGSGGGGGTGNGVAVTAAGAGGGFGGGGGGGGCSSTVATTGAAGAAGAAGFFLVEW